MAFSTRPISDGRHSLSPLLAAGRAPGEGLGRLLNRYCEVDGEIVQWKLVPGLVAFTDTLMQARAA